MIKWDYVVIEADRVLHGAVVSLDFWNVFVSRCDVKLGVQIGKVAMHLLKLIVSKHDGNFKTSDDVYTDQGFEVLKYVEHLLVYKRIFELIIVAGYLPAVYC